MSSHRPPTPPEKRRRRNKTDWQRLAEKYVVNDETGCWEWTACRTPAGYGQFYFEGRRNNFAHRAAYIMLVGPIPDDKVIDHLCKVRHCCNPAHLEPVTQRENLIRGDGFSGNARSDSCPNGHPYTPENMYVRPKGPPRRECLTCRKTYAARRFTALRDASVTPIRAIDEQGELWAGGESA